MLARILLTTITELTDGIINNHNDIEKIYSNYCLSKLKALLTEIDAKHPETPLNADLAAPLVALLETNYRVTKHTDMSPTMSYQSPHTVACLIVAQTLEKIVSINRYKLLHPELEVFDYVASGTSLNDDNHEISSFIMSDDGKRIIEIQACLAFAENDGVLKHTCLVDGQTMPLSPTETDRVVNYLKETKKYWEAITHKVQVETKGESFGAILTTLIHNLREGGRRRKGEESKAGHDANVGIINFVDWFTHLEEDEKKLLRQYTYRTTRDSYITFGEMYDRLVAPENFIDTIYCVEVISDHIGNILSNNKQLHETYPKKYKSPTSVPKLQDAVREMEAKKFALGKAMHGHIPSPRYGNNGCQHLAANMAELADLQLYISPTQWREWFEYQIKNISEENRLALVTKFAVWFNKLYTNTADYDRLFKMLDLHNPFGLIEVLEAVKEKPAETVKDYKFYLESHNCKDCHRKIIAAIQDKIASFEDMYLLVKFTQDDKCKLADKHKKYIDTADKFWQIVESLPANKDSFAFILQFSHFITNTDEFYCLAKKFADPYCTYLYVIFAKTCFSSLGEFVCYDDPWHRNKTKLFELLLSLKMTDGLDLKKLLVELPLPSEQRLFVANHFSALIKNGNQLTLVLVQLDREHRFPFLRAHQSCIKNGDDLAYATAVTYFDSNVSKLQFVESFIDKVTTDEQLAKLLEQFSFKEGCYLMRLAASKSKTISNPSVLINNSLFYTPRSLQAESLQPKAVPPIDVKVYEGDRLVYSSVSEEKPRFFIDA